MKALFLLLNVVVLVAGVFASTMLAPGWTFAAKRSDSPTIQLVARDPAETRPACALATISGVDYAVTIDWDCVDRRVNSIVQDQQLNLQDAFALSLQAVRKGTAK